MGPRDGDEEDCDHDPEVFEQDAEGSPTVRCRCGRVVEHMLIDGEDLATQEVDLSDTDRDDLADTEPSPDSWGS